MSKFLKAIVNLFLIFSILVTGAILIPPILGVSTTMIESAAMDTNLPVGSITYSQSVSISEITPGDTILSEVDKSVNVYDVESVDVIEGKFVVLDKTDPQSEPKELTIRNDALKVVLTIPFIGYIMIAMHSVEGLIIIGLIVLFVIILFILSELWRKSEDDEDDEEDEDSEEDDDQVDAEEERISQVEGWEENKDALVEDSLADDEKELTAASDEDSAETSEEAMLELSSDELAKAIAATMKTDTVEDEIVKDEIIEEQKDVEVDADVQVYEEATAVSETDESMTFVRVARPSLDEIVAKAEHAGDQPEVIPYDTFGVTVVDYSKCI